MAGNDHNQEDLEKWLDKADAGSAAAPGEFTRTFFAAGTEAAQKPAPADSRALSLPARNVEDPLVSSQAGTEVFDARSQQETFDAPRPDSFTKLFQFETLHAQPVQPPAQTHAGLTDLLRAASAASPPPPVVANDSLASAEFAPRAQNMEFQPPPDSGGEELAQPFPARGTGDVVRNQEKATELFSLEKPMPARINVPGVPSAFTRVVNSSALRSAQEESAPAPASPPAAAAPLPMPQFAPAPLPSWLASPPQAPAPHLYVQGNVMPAQMPSPQMMPVPSWPPAQPVPFPSMAPAPPQMQPQPFQEPPSSKWAAYMPLIIALNVLFFVAVIVILIFALTK